MIILVKKMETKKYLKEKKEQKEIRRNWTKRSLGYLIGLWFFGMLWGLVFSTDEPGVINIIVVLMIAIMIWILQDSDFSIKGAGRVCKHTLIIGIISMFIGLFFSYQIINNWIWALIILVVAEIIFFKDKAKLLPGENRFKLTTGRKIIALWKSTTIIALVGGTINGTAQIIKSIDWVSVDWVAVAKTYLTISAWSYFITSIIIAVTLVVMLYIYLNSLKYKEKE